MPISLDHTIVWVHDHAESAAFLGSVLGLAEPERFGPFLVFRMDNGVSLDLYEQGRDAKIGLQHYAFRVDPDKFGEILAGVRARGLEYWADPGRTRAREVYGVACDPRGTVDYDETAVLRGGSSPAAPA